MAQGFTWLSSLVMSEVRSDVKIIVEETAGGNKVVIPAHSFVLCCQSDVFAAMLESERFVEGRTREIELKLYSPRTVEYFLRFLYARETPETIPISNRLELLKLSHHYQAEELLKHCISILLNNLAVSTVLEVLECATLLDIANLKNSCTNFIKTNRKAIEDNDVHFILPVDRLSAVFNPPLNDTALIRTRRWYTCLGVSLEEVCSPPVLNQGTGSNRDSHTEFVWLTELYLSKSFSDVSVCIEDGSIKFPAHSFILMHQSPLFMSTWNSWYSREDKGDESGKCTVTLSTMDTRVAEFLLRFIYTQRLSKEISDSNCTGLLKLAVQYEVKGLRAACLQLLTNRVSLENCCSLLSTFKGLGCGSFEEHVKSVIIDKWDSVIQNHLHFVFTKDLIDEVLKGVKGTKLESAKTRNLIMEWAKWRACLLGLSSDLLQRLVDPIMALALQVPRVYR